MPTAPARILVVDDEPDLRTLYELTLLRDGHHVSTAANLAQASALLASQRFDVLITDMRLPDGLGMALLHELHQQQRQERSIVITAYGSAENAVEALRYGAFDYLTKPVDLKQFRRVVASATEGLPAPNTPAAPALATPACSAPPLAIAASILPLVPHWSAWPANPPPCNCCASASKKSPPAWHRCSSRANRARAKSWSHAPCTPAATAATARGWR